MPRSKPAAPRQPGRTSRPATGGRSSAPNPPKGRATSDRRSSKDLYPKPPFPRQHQESPGLESRLDPAPRWKGEHYRPAGKLEGRRALITGGDSGIGRSVAYFFAREGADVAIVCLPEEREDARVIEEAVTGLGRRCVVLEGDLTDAEFCAECIRQTVDALGGLDILVHNAAQQTRTDSVEDVTEEQLDRTLKTNVYAYLRLVRAALPGLKPGSSIIATGSVVGIKGSGELPEYSASKGAIHTLTKTLAEQLLDKGIRVNCVAPGPVWTPLNASDAGASPKDVSEFGKDSSGSQMGRPAQPEELAPAYVFLASNADSSYITGAVIPVIGGPV